jgi:hypothetical protein
MAEKDCQAVHGSGADKNYRQAAQVDLRELTLTLTLGTEASLLIGGKSWLRVILACYTRSPMTRSAEHPAFNEDAVTVNNSMDAAGHVRSYY